jgi:hypothetical protein
MTSTKSRIAMAIASFATVVFLAGAIYAGWSWMDVERRAAALRDDGVETTGTVVNATMAPGTINKMGVASSARYYITYRFVDSIGTPREAMSNGTGAAYSELRVGEEIPIRFLPRDPDVSVYDRAPDIMNASPLMVLSLLLGLSVCCGAYVWSDVRRHWHRV